jgi:hypothetical protein
VPNKWSWIALGAGAYAAFVVATFPAATAYRWLAPPEVRLASVDGTVWSGTAALGSMPGLPLRDIRWNLSALPLLLGRDPKRGGSETGDPKRVLYIRDLIPPPIRMMKDLPYYKFN